MKKGLYRPKQQKSFFDNYKALIAAMAFLMISLSVSAQQYDSLKARQPVNTYGSDINNLRAKYSMILPKDSTHLAVSDSGGIAYKNGGVYFWNGYRWVTIATGTTPTDYWSVTGNTGISNSNFLGAINNVPTRIRSNNIELAYFNGDDYRTVINNGAAMSNYSLAMNYGMVGIRYAVTSYTSATKKIVINGIDLTSRILVNDLLEGFEQDVLTDEFDATVSTVTFTGGNTEIVLTTDPIGGNATNMWFVDITTKYTSISRYGFGVGHLSVAQGNYSTSIGNRTWAYGNYSTALGYISNATGNYSVSIGASVNATGDYSFAMGNGTTASGLNSFSLGNTSTASGSTSATLNSNNTSSGQNSFSANYGNTASGASSFALGEGNKSKSYGGAVIGTYNDSTNATSSTAYSSTNRAFQIGVGTADNARSNAMTVLFSGKTTLNKYGVGTFTGTPAYTLQVNSNGDIIEGAVITNPVTGTGTANQDAYWTSTTAIGGSALKTFDPTSNFSQMIKGANGGGIKVGGYNATIGGIWSAAVTPSTANYFIGGDANHTYINSPSGSTYISSSGVAKWVFNSSGHFLASTDNSYDIGASGATRPRTGYFGTSINVAGATLTGTTFQLPTFTLQNSNAVQVMSSYDNVYAYIMRAFTGRTDVSGTKTLLTVGESFSWLPNAANTATYSNTLFNSTLNPGVSNSGGTFENVKSKVIETTTTGLTARYLYSGYSGVAGTTQKFYVNTVGDGYFAGNVGIGTTSPNSTLHTNGSFATAYRAITALRTLDGTDYTIEVTANTFTVTLPTAVGITGRIYVITNSGSGVTTVGTTSSQTFANVLTTPTTLSLAQYSTVMVQSNGANWLRLTNL